MRRKTEIRVERNLKGKRKKKKKRPGIEAKTAEGASRRGGRGVAGPAPRGAHIRGIWKGPIGILSRR